jgi:hypothetical protein
VLFLIDPQHLQLVQREEQQLLLEVPQQQEQLLEVDVTPGNLQDQTRIQWNG